MLDVHIEAPHTTPGLPFGVWWAIGEAVAAAMVLPALRLLGVL